MDFKNKNPYISIGLCYTYVKFPGKYFIFTKYFLILASYYTLTQFFAYLG